MATPANQLIQVFCTLSSNSISPSERLSSPQTTGLLLLPVSAPASSRVRSSNVNRLCCDGMVPISLITIFEIVSSVMGFTKRPSLSSLKSRQAIMLAIVIFGGVNTPFHSECIVGLYIVDARELIVMLYGMFHFS